MRQDLACSFSPQRKQNRSWVPNIARRGELIWWKRVLRFNRSYLQNVLFKWQDKRENIRIQGFSSLLRRTANKLPTKVQNIQRQRAQPNRKYQQSQQIHLSLELLDLQQLLSLELGKWKQSHQSTEERDCNQDVALWCERYEEDHHSLC